MDILAWIITITWGISFILDAWLREYDPPITVHVLMTAVGATAFTGNLIVRKDPE